MATSKKAKKLVVDTNAFIKAVRIENIGQEFYTIPQVIIIIKGIKWIKIFILSIYYSNFFTILRVSFKQQKQLSPFYHSMLFKFHTNSSTLKTHFILLHLIMPKNTYSITYFSYRSLREISTHQHSINCHLF